MDSSHRPRTRLADDLQAVGRLTFAQATQRLLEELFAEFPAEQGFFLVWAPPSVEDAARQLVVITAVSSDGEAIEHPDYHLDQHYLREIGALEGPRLLSGIEGVGRPLLSCSVALENGKRGVVVLEGAPGAAGFSETNLEPLHDALRQVEGQLQLLFRMSERDQEVRVLRTQLDELTKQLEVRELERGGIRTVSEDDRFLQEDITHYQEIITRSQNMKELFNVIERVKDTDINVLVVGETGTGKELIARAIHYGGARAARPFETVACGSIPLNLLESELFGYTKGAFSGADADKKGVFQRADGGTVFLDEVSDMPNEMQQKILRVLQEKVIRPVGAQDLVPVNVRIISATQKDLPELVQRKTFREDLYYRLNVITLEVPPLRERRDDIPLLLEHFTRERIEDEEVTKRFSDSALRELYQYAWPGNVQELKNLVTRAFVASTKKIISRRVVMPLLTNQAGNLFYGKEIYQEGDHIHLSVPCQEGFNEIIAECEKLILLTALRRNRGNKSRVTQQLGIPRQTLYNKLEKYGIVEEDYLSDD